MTVFDPKTGLMITIAPSQARALRVEADAAAAIGDRGRGLAVFDYDKAARALPWITPAAE
jgi:hypothetical protein